MSSRIGLLASIGLNAALATALLVIVTRRSAPSASPETFTAKATTTPASAASSAGASSAAPSSDWIERLRAANVPGSVIAATAAADFDQRWWRRQRELQRQFTRGDIDEATLLRFSDRRDQEQEDELRATLGPELFRTWHQKKLLDDFERAGVALSSAESDRVYHIRTQHLAQLRQLEQARADGLLDEAEFTENASIAQHLHERHVATLIGEARQAALHDDDPEELGSLRRNLRAAHASDQQVAAVMRAQSEWSQQRKALDRELLEGRLTVDVHERRIEELTAARTRAQATALGAEGLAAFQRASDPRHTTLTHFAGAWGLTENEVSRVSALLRSFDERARQQRQAHPAISPEGDAAIRTVERDAEQALRELLGDDRFARMQRTGVLQLSE